MHRAVIIKPWTVRSVKDGQITEHETFTEAYLYAKRVNGLPLRLQFKPATK